MKNNIKKQKEKVPHEYFAMEDFFFLKYMGEIGNETQQRGLLKALGIEIEGKITHLNPKIPGSTQNKKSSRLDLRILTDCGKDINIEIQRQETKDFIPRLLDHACKRIIQSVIKGKNYDSMKNILSIAICDFEIFDSVLYHNIVKLNTSNIYIHEELIDKLEIHIIELPKLRKSKIFEEDKDGKIIETKKDLKYNRKHQYLTFIDDKTTHEQRKEIVKMGDEGLKESMKHLEIAFENGAFDEYFEIKREKIHQESIIKEKIEEGIKEGIKKGKEEGIKEGKEENKIEIVTKMKKDGVSIEYIAKTTDLSPETIEKL